MSIAAEIIVMASLLGAAAFDVAKREIPDTCSALILGAAILIVGAEPQQWREALLAFSAGLVLFAAGAALFAAGIWGGGDVKLSAAVGAVLTYQIRSVR